MYPQQLDLFAIDGTVVAEIELVYKSHRKINNLVSVSESKNSFAIFQRFFNPNTIDLAEEAWAMFLDRAGSVLALLKLSQGGTSSTSMDPKLILIAALRVGAHGIILSHNHPSCRLQPSQEDKRLTSQIKKAAELINIRLFDHLIISRHGYHSMADQGDL